MKIQPTIFDFNTAQALLWQYAQAERLESLVLQKQDWENLNVSAWLSDWYDNVFNLETADANGLYVWSVILNVPLYSTIPPVPADYPVFGFADFAFNFFGNPINPVGSNFSTGGGSGGGIGNLTIQEQRQLLQLRYFQLTTNGSVTEINRALAYIFGNGNAYVLDNLDMTMSYVFVDGISFALQQALKQLDILPRPAAVQLYDAEPVQEGFSFGFADFGRNFLSPVNFLRTLP